MADFDWVTCRAQCSAKQKFEELYLSVSNDVDVRNKLQPNNPSYGFRIERAGDRFTVYRESNRLSGHVTFTLEQDAIEAKRDERNIFTATLTLDNEGLCKFKIKEEEQESWQVRKRALESLFFDGGNKKVQQVSASQSQPADWRSRMEPE